MPFDIAMELDRQQAEAINARLDALAHSQDHSLLCAGYECTCHDVPDSLFQEDPA